MSSTIQTSKLLNKVEISHFKHLREPLLNILSEAVRFSLNLKHIAINNCSLNDEDLLILSKGLSSSNTLNTIDLSYNCLTKKSGIVVGKILSNQGQKKDELIWSLGLRGERPKENLLQKGLRDLILIHNNFQDDGVKDICDFLKFDSWLRSLNMRNNGIQKEGIIKFIQMLDQNKTLLALDLRGNEGFNRKASEIILECLTDNMKKFKNSFNTKKKEKKRVKKHSPKVPKPNPFSKSKNSIKSLQLSSFLEDKKTNEIEGNKNCTRCCLLEKKLIKAESRIVNLCIENAKLKNANLSSVQITNEKDIKLILVNSGEGEIELPEKQDKIVINKIEYLMSELTRLMDNLESHKDNTITGRDHFSNNTSNIYNNTVEYVNEEENPINFNSSDISPIQNNTDDTIEVSGMHNNGNHEDQDISGDTFDPKQSR